LFGMDFGSGPSASGATDSVFKSLTLRNLVFEYFYDAEGKRRLKAYPTGIHDEYFYDRNKRMLLDQGNPSPLPSSAHPVDEYVWLDERPIALIRSKLDASWFHEGTADCTRLGDFSPCGVYHLVTDYLGKPVLMIDSQGRVTGTGEYAPSGHVNRVSVDIETPHPYTTTTAAFGSVMKQPAVTGTSLQQRVLFDNLGLFNQGHDCPSGGMESRKSNALLTTVFDSIEIQDATTNSPLITVSSSDSGGGKNHGHQWTNWFVPGTNGVKAHLNNSGVAYCEEGFDCSGIQCIPVCGCNTTATQKKRIGATISAYEYRRFQTGATPAWTPLRHPGQYFDVESDLFENWNRFYDPIIGKYLQPELLLQAPVWVKEQAKSGMNSPAYVYAANNPLHFTDPTGLYIRTGECKNWDKALQRAKEKAGCDSGQPGPPRCSCKLPCNICDYLMEGRLPHAGILTPAQLGGLNVYGGVGPSDTLEGGVGAGFSEMLCGNNKDYPAGIELLAQAMVHEAIHVCKYLAGVDSPATNDAWSRPYFNFGPDDAEDVTAKCFNGND
ncbi:RHS repeat-associated core domain-containing protein, partial [Myxococcus fulvus]|uniref:RHS repeat-associated core domain-containing protein n=1 Tax=Myxococcus fulvus TaxID=33 RepID=UPI003B997936